MNDVGGRRAWRINAVQAGSSKPHNVAAKAAKIRRSPWQENPQSDKHVRERLAHTVPKPNICSGRPIADWSVAASLVRRPKVVNHWGLTPIWCLYCLLSFIWSKGVVLSGVFISRGKRGTGISIKSGWEPSRFGRPVALQDVDGQSDGIMLKDVLEKSPDGGPLQHVQPTADLGHGDVCDPVGQSVRPHLLQTLAQRLIGRFSAVLFLQGLKVIILR